MGLILLVGERPVRGATEHFYRLVEQRRARSGPEYPGDGTDATDTPLGS